MPAETETSNTDSDKTDDVLSNEEKALLMKSIWKALLAPNWTKDDLIALGKLIFAKTPLSKIPDREYFDMVQPQLLKVAEALSRQIYEQAGLPPDATKENDDEKTTREEPKK